MPMWYHLGAAMACVRIVSSSVRFPILKVAGGEGRDPLKKWQNELQHLRQEFGIKLFSFVDDDFFGPKVDGKTHAERVAEALIEKNVDLNFLISVQPRDIEYDSCAYAEKSRIGQRHPGNR